MFACTWIGGHDAVGRRNGIKGGEEMGCIPSSLIPIASHSQLNNPCTSRWPCSICLPTATTTTHTAQLSVVTTATNLAGTSRPTLMDPANAARIPPTSPITTATTTTHMVRTITAMTQIHMVPTTATTTTRMALDAATRRTAAQEGTSHLLDWILYACSRRPHWQ